MKVTHLENGKTKIFLTCHICKKVEELEVSTEKYNSWKGGTLIQRALPELSLEDRELLISQTCSSCFDSLFGDIE